MSYILGGTTLPRPKIFRREFIEVKSEMETINGRHTKDISADSRKEKYIIGWDLLTAAEISSIVSLVEQNQSLTFSVSETNLTISSTSVWPYMKSRSYSTPAGYLEATQLELIEVS